ncbi:PepSY domain-containing protein [Salinicoccus sp. Marseille-QA3877]
MKINKYTLMAGTLASALVLGACSTVSADENLEWSDEDNNGVANVQTEETNEFKYSVQEAVDMASERFEGTATEVELDEDDGVYYYEIEMENGEDEYEVKINADDLSISEEEIDREDDKEAAREEQRKTTTETDSQSIGMDEAVQIAKDKVGGGDVTDKEFDKDDNDYEIEIVHEGFEYDVEINATTGEIKDFDQDDESDEGTQSTSSADSEFIGMEKAVQIAKDKVGGGDVTDKEFDKDDNDYEIELVYDGSEYDVEINATTGEVTDIDQENKSDREYTNNIEFEGEFISSEEALNIALDAVGGGTVDEWDLDKEDNEFDIEIDYDGSEYEVEIHATTGKVIDVEQDD